MSKKLMIYEKMEDELDDVIMQAAESELQYTFQANALGYRFHNFKTFIAFTKGTALL